MYVVPQHFLFSTPRSVIVFQQEWMVVFASALGIRKGIFHGTRIWVHIGDMGAYIIIPVCVDLRIFGVFWRALCLSLRRQF
jgi:hypothetical protein